MYLMALEIPLLIEQGYALSRRARLRPVDVMMNSWLALEVKLDNVLDGDFGLTSKG